MIGFRATVVISDPVDCPIADVSTAADGAIDSVTRTRSTGPESRVVEEFAADGTLADADLDVSLRTVQSTDRETVYRFDRGGDGACACELVETLRDQYDGVLVEELSREGGGTSGDPVVVDRNALTDRQREIVETAHELGYFDYPKGANATDVAAEPGVARSTFTEHLAAAQTKLFDALLET